MRLKELKESVIKIKERSGRLIYNTSLFIPMYRNVIGYMINNFDL